MRVPGLLKFLEECNEAGAIGLKIIARRKEKKKIEDSEYNQLLDEIGDVGAAFEYTLKRLPKRARKRVEDRVAMKVARHMDRKLPGTA